jgi:hypothetical protein
MNGRRSLAIPRQNAIIESVLREIGLESCMMTAKSRF